MDRDIKRDTIYSSCGASGAIFVRGNKLKFWFQTRPYSRFFFSKFEGPTTARAWVQKLVEASDFNKIISATYTNLDIRIRRGLSKKFRPTPWCVTCKGRGGLIRCLPFAVRKRGQGKHKWITRNLFMVRNFYTYPHHHFLLVAFSCPTNRERDHLHHVPLSYYLFSFHLQF